MKIPNKKLKSGFSMPAFGIGTWKMGGRFKHNTKNDDERDIKAIRQAIKLGVTHIDTAEIYANGYSEKIVAKTIKNMDRSNLFITSKVPGFHLSYNDVLKSAENSLKRLQINYLDLYLIHWPNDEIPLKQTIKAMDKLIDEGLVKNIGVSNFAVKRMQQAQNYSNNKIVCNQVHYNLIFREPERKLLLNYCQENDIFLNAWRPIKFGILKKPGINMLNEMCKKYKKTPAQIAINWLISQKNVITISKSSNIKHLKENLGAIDWKMEKKDIEYLRKNFPNQKDESDIIPLT